MTSARGGGAHPNRQAVRTALASCPAPPTRVPTKTQPAGHGRQRGTAKEKSCRLSAIPAHGGGDGGGQPTMTVGELRQTNLLMLPTYS
eukprot:scaffold30015_cov124-Isochrysis_galbana.AAC.1